MRVNFYKYIFYPLIFLLNQTNKFSTPPLFHPPIRHYERKLKFLLSFHFSIPSLLILLLFHPPNQTNSKSRLQKLSEHH